MQNSLEEELSTVVQTFSISGRGTAIAIGDFPGVIKNKDWVKVQKTDGQFVDLRINSVENADHRLERKSNVCLMVKGIRPEDIAIGALITIRRQNSAT
jgi:hypothetical protein